MPIKKGKFWSWVRPLIWEKAEELFMEDQMRTMDCDIKPERSELREGGYFYNAKLIVLADLYRQKKGRPSVQEEEMLAKYGGRIK